jgi:CRP-like cAMP-binding protein
VGLEMPQPGPMQVPVLKQAASQQVLDLALGLASSCSRNESSGATAVGRLARNRVLFWQGEPRLREIEIFDGVVRAVHILPNGERHILAFFWPGEVILPARNLQSYTAEAVTTCLVRSARTEAAIANAGADDQVLQRMLLLQAIKQRNALARVSWFLIRMRAHLRHVPQMPDVFKFVIPRNDIANYIGTSLETVCRSLTELKGLGVVEMPDRGTIWFRNPDQLTRIANGLDAPRSWVAGTGHSPPCNGD